jgi:hypothetical protein
MVQETSQTLPNIKDSEWVEFPGGELAGKRPKALCQACREDVGRALLDRRHVGGAGRTCLDESPSRRTLCFQCYRADIERDRVLKAAGQLNTASEERFQTQLPFEPVNRPRLEMLKADRLTARSAAAVTTSGKFADRRRQAQLAARHALQQIASGFGRNGSWKPTGADHEREIAAAIHAAELQLPEAWLPFVVAR